MNHDTRKNPAVAAPTPSQYVKPNDKNEDPEIMFETFGTAESQNLR
jgi:hypothetical protein